ncbi:alpha-E domain-containing protein [Pseudobacteriovorax antillogorgiicola]|uniref:Uncharacterized conserved protein, Alpha-E superfamily n=1 Tax=Pseudobacteriovorax antillogorgiicola TaxID=1513793 RepID=A0A1Y6BWQ7_9BACT|nr:alpha-E domain-containing protein [Pseudobacteriovorax antillogorgiicola]TCS53167.1 putative alpha-E superfamily protein [Pseudobacteriovorax antillogorgiicola]SMF24920.1 Uncharacterized conserved protein, Alpha-E superfamily [Pseudobacteriovorax antillogorgiicola]
MLSRVAESIYWMNRYVERAENVARFLHVNLHLMLDYPGESPQQQWEPLVTTSGDDEDFFKRYGVASEENVIRFLTFDEENPNSIISCLHAARENGRTIQDTISSEMWEHLNQFYLMVEKHSRKKTVRSLHDFYSSVKNASHLYVGLAETTMSHGEGWHFGKLGRLLERADKTARILDVKYFILLPKLDDVNTPYDSLFWSALLKSASAFEMYRKRFHKIFHHDVADFLIFDPKFPRSLYCCTLMAQHSMNMIQQKMPETPPAALELEKLLRSFQTNDIDFIVNNGLHEFIDTFQYNLNIVGREIQNSFFALKPIEVEQSYRNCC